MTPYPRTSNRITYIRKCKWAIIQYMQQKSDKKVWRKAQSKVWRKRGLKLHPLATNPCNILKETLINRTAALEQR